MYVLLRRNFQLEVKYYIRKEKQQFKNNDEVCCYDDIAACRIDGWRNQTYARIILIGMYYGVTAIRLYFQIMISIMRNLEK